MLITLVFLSSRSYTLAGYSGNDILAGGAGNDVLWGGLEMIL